MSRLLCCRRARHADMGAALSQPQEGDACEGAGLPAAPPTMADVIRERKKKAGGAGLGTLRRRIAAAARRPRDNRPDRGCEHARYIRSVVRGWRVGEVVVVLEALEAGAALRDLVTQAELAREPAPALHADLARASAERLCCDVELHGKGFSLHAHRALLAARSTYFRDLLARHPTGSGRVPLEGVGAGLSREEVEAVVGALYAGTSLCARRPLCDMCVAAKWERGGNAEVDLDIINVENTGTCRSLSRCVCGRSRVNAAAARRLAEPLGYSLDTLHHDMRYLLDSGEYADARLSFRVEGGAQYGFRTALELPCHRVVLAARSRFFRSVMCRRGAGAGGGGAVCVDEKVLPRRFARALLHAAYTDQVDLSLIGRCTSSPSSTNSTGSGNTSWPGVARGNSSSRPTTTAMLDDAFQLYEIARFLEMPIVVQGCEDAIVEALSAETLPHVLRWSSAPHASQWVHRQAMRYLRDEFPAIMSSTASSRLPRSALAGALASPFLQASEPSALRALLRWAERAVANQDQHSREPNVVWHTAHSAARRGGRRRDLSEQALREALQPLVAHVRLEHMPPDHDLLQQVIRRGLIPQPPQHMVEGGSTADAWLGKGAARPPRCFLPYLDEIKALVEHQTVAECEVMAARRGRYVHRIPDTLYMVAAGAGEGAGPVSGAGPGPGAGAEGACVSPRVLAALRARVRRLRAAPNAVRALALHATDPRPVQTQIALRAVREMSLPDTCAELLLNDNDANSDRECGRSSASGSGGEWDSPRMERSDHWVDQQPDCCRSRGSGSLRCASTSSLRSHLALESSRSSTCRRDMSPRPADASHHRESTWSVGGEWSSCRTRSGGAGGPTGGQSGAQSGGRLSAAVPDVAMAPNANTHLLTARDYFRHAPPWEYSGGVNGVLQLDLGDGATHTPRPGSRAQRAAANRHSRDQNQLSTTRSRPDEDELRAAIELSVIRAYSSYQGQGRGSPPPAVPLAPTPRPRNASATLPTNHHQHRTHHAHGVSSRGSPSPSSLSASNSAHLSAPSAPPQSSSSSSSHRHAEMHTPDDHHSLRVYATGVSGGSGLSSGSGLSGGGSAARRTSSPRRPHRDYTLYRHHDYRLDGNYGSSGSGSRGPSPNSYA